MLSDDTVDALCDQLDSNHLPPDDTFTGICDQLYSNHLPQDRLSVSPTIVLLEYESKFGAVRYLCITCECCVFEFLQLLERRFRVVRSIDQHKYYQILFKGSLLVCFAILVRSDAEPIILITEKKINIWHLFSLYK